MKRKIYLWYIGLIAKFKNRIWWWKGNLKTFLWFQLRSWNALMGKEMIMDSRKVKSNGGFIYHQMEISKCPLSKTDMIE